MKQNLPIMAQNIFIVYKMVRKMAVTNKIWKWCPLGCGKCVKLFKHNYKKTKLYIQKTKSTYKCTRCNNLFEHDELGRYQ